MIHEETTRRRRTTRACDQCKLARTKCEEAEAFAERGLASKSCKACKATHQTCTYTTPARRRGPAPGLRHKRQRVSPNHESDSPPYASDKEGTVVASAAYTSYPSLAFRPSAGKESPQAEAGPSNHSSHHVQGIPSAIVDELLVTYFTHVHNLWPIIYKPHFALQSTPLPLLLAMLCVASCVAPASAKEGFDSEKLYHMAESSVRQCWGETRIELAQAILLLSLRQTGCGDKQSAFWYAAQACTMALSLGLNNASNRPGGTDAIEEQVRSRVWWSCYLIDKCLAEEVGRPCLLRYRGCTTPLPAIDEMDELETWPPLPMTSAPLPPSVRGIRPRRGHVVSAFVWTCRLAMIVENILELDLQGPPVLESFDGRFRAEVLSIQPDRMEESIAVQLSDFRSTLPAYLNLDPIEMDIPPLPQVAILITWHATATILFYSRYIQPRNDPSNGQPSSSSLHHKAYALCAAAAQTTIDTIAQLDKHGLLKEACADFLYIISLTTLFETFDCTNPDPSIAQQSKDNLTRCCTWLRDFSSSWPAASAQKLFYEGLIQGGMRLSSPDIDDGRIDLVTSNTGPSPGTATNATPAARSPMMSTSFPSVHRALYAVQGKRLTQAAEVDLSNFMQLPQFYWNNWDQFGSTANANVGWNATMDGGPIGYMADGVGDNTQWTWDTPTTSSGVQYHDSTSTIQPNGMINMPGGSQSGSLEGPDQAAITAALLKYMLRGNQQNVAG